MQRARAVSLANSATFSSLIIGTVGLQPVSNRFGAAGVLLGVVLICVPLVGLFAVRAWRERREILARTLNDRRQCVAANHKT
jgi:hypothetical protein